MITLKQALVNTNRMDKQLPHRAQIVRAFWREKGSLFIDRKRQRAYRLYKQHAKPPRTDKTQRVFTQWLRVYDPPASKRGPRTAGTMEVWGRCSCQYFCFTNEVALTRVGSSSVRYSNGDPPVVRNPGGVPFFCKHLYILALKVLRLEEARIETLKRKAGERDPAASKQDLTGLIAAPVHSQSRSLVNHPSRSPLASPTEFLSTILFGKAGVSKRAVDAKASRAVRSVSGRSPDSK